MKGSIRLGLKYDTVPHDLPESDIDVNYDSRIVEIKKGNKTTIIPFESINFIEIVRR